jgi:GT2 family glycosyltransferase
VTLVLSNGATSPEEAGPYQTLHDADRLGFTTAVNRGLENLGEDIEAVAVLNDDALPSPGWLHRLTAVLETRPDTAAVQGTVANADGTCVDGRGIAFDRWGLPVQVDRGRPLSDDQGERAVVAVSGTACLYRMKALRQIALANREIFDERFDCYHEDLDLGLRLLRSGWSVVWTGGAPVRHLGSASGRAFSWRHPWWLLANRWRALAGNLTPAALIRALPLLLRGEARAVNTLARTNARAVPTAAAVLGILPVLVVGGWLRTSRGPRLETIPGRSS